MKKTLLSLMIGLSVTTPVLADNLLEVYQQALANDPVVNNAKALRDAAYKGIPISRASLLPQISGSVDYTIYNGETSTYSSTTASFVAIDYDYTSFEYGIDLSMSLYDHANWLGLDRAELIAEQSDATYAATMQELIVRTVSAYLGVLRAIDNVEFVGAEKRAIERQLEQTKQRFEVGLTAITDVHEAQANYDTTVAQEIVAQNQVEVAREALRVITGSYHANLDALDTDKFSPTLPKPESVNEWLDIAEDSNLTLLAQRLQADIAKQDIDIATSGHYPTLDLAASIDRKKNEVNDSNLPRLDSNTIALSLSVPIYSGGSIQAGVEQQRANYVAASEDVELAHRQTVQSVRSSYNDVKAAISTIRAFQQAVVSAESALQATEAGFDVGTRTIVDVLDSTRNLFDARRNLSGARYDFIEAMVTLKQASGTLSGKDIEMLNNGMTAVTAKQ
jgi:outer membrane protein